MHWYTLMHKMPVQDSSHGVSGGPRYTHGMTLTADDPRPPKAQIAAILRGEIRAGKPGPGKKLPSIRALAKRFDVAPGTVQAALDLLRQESLVHSPSNQGTYVREDLPPEEALAENATVVVDRNVLLQINETLARLDERVAALEAERRD